jgi:hypothetical protein
LETSLPMLVSSSWPSSTTSEGLAERPTCSTRPGPTGGHNH